MPSAKDSARNAITKLGKLKSKIPAKSSNQYLVGLDIGTENVKALIAEIKGEKIEIIGVGRAHQRLSDMQSGAIADIAGVVANCENALSQAEKSSGISARACVIGIAGELVKGVTHTIRYNRPKPEQPIDEAEVQFIVSRAQERAEAKAKAQLAVETGNKDVEIKLVNSAIVAMHIDTYKVSNPLGFQGKEIKMQIYTAFAPMVHIGALERTAQQLDLDLIAVAAEPFAVSRSVIGTDSSSTFSAILIDVGGGTSDIAVVDDGGVQGTRMFGIGGRSFTKTIASELDINFDEAEKIKLNLDGNINGSIKAKALTAIDKTLDVWVDGVELSLSEFKSIDHLPNRLLLCGGGSSLGALMSALANQDWYKELPFTRRPSVEHINPDQVIGVTDQTGLVHDHTFITAMGLLRVGYDTIVGAEGGSRIRDTINRLLSV